jgi:NADPH:quinone reductase-like Zn-dependent oxidoreductase
MRAFVFDRYGPPDVLQLREVAKPAPRADELLVRVRATTVSSADCRVRAMNVPAGFGLASRLVFGVRKPRQPILGTEFAGDVEAVGGSVVDFRVGDRVFGMSGARMGCHAEYKCMAAQGAVALIPPGVGYDEAAALCFGGTTALDFFRRGGLKGGDRVLINGASGAVGTAAVQLARHSGAEVTGVCSGANAELVRSLGATHVIDYTREDFTRSGRRYDVIVDTVGSAPFSRSRRALEEGGRLLLVLAGLPQLLAIPWVALTGSRRIIAGPAAERPEDVRLLAELVAAGRFRPVIDRRYPFEELAEAHRYVDTGRKRGNVVIAL